ncbi:MAG TPA: IGHMBP2 family helicase [Planctomycetota bacterium]|nr:IGHMBP2 family helicase [Planctomycetota bacterium]
MASSTSIGSFVETTRRLLDLERKAEVDETARLHASFSAEELEARGVVLLRLRVAEESWGPGGRTLLALEPTRGGELPASRFQPGDIVSLRPARGATPPAGAPAGVVFRISARRITVALDDAPEEPLEEPVRIDRVANDVTYRRCREALDRLSRLERGPAARLRDVLFGLHEPRFGPPGVLEALDPALDHSQRDAVAFALEARDIALVHGPPGTGKTTAAVELIRQGVKRGEKVLACAGSNIATDNLVERLAAAGVRVVRLGHPARLLPSVIECSLDSLVEKSEASRIAVDLKRELESLRRRLRKSEAREERRALRDDLRRLRAEARGLEDRAVRDVISSADVILATNAGAGDSVLDGFEFDRVVIDEAAQALEVSCWIPLLRGRGAVLAGDHLQLPPTIRSEEAMRGGLGITLFDRLAAERSDSVLRMLRVQYRMHERIMEWPSKELYGGKLEAHPSVAGHLLSHISGVEECPETSAPLFFIDTAGCGHDEAREAEGDSKSNEGEVEIVLKHVETLLGAGLEPGRIAVITPYNAQVDRLRAVLRPLAPALEVGSVDGFQGREKEAVVISLVRSNERGEVGFLADDRRMNVAVTRARRHLAVIGDSATVSRRPFLARLLEHLEKRGEYRSGWEYR